MDIQRTGVKKRKFVRGAVIIAVLLVATGGITYGVNQLQPALPSVEKGSLWFGTVKRGPMLRQVHGIGALVPEQVVWISAVSEGRIEHIYVQPGTVVKPDTVIMDLSNPALQEAMVAAEFDMKQAQATLADLEATLQSSAFDKQSAAAQMDSDYNDAQITAERDRQLTKLGLAPALDAKKSENKAHELATRNKLAQQQLGLLHSLEDAQLNAQRVKIEQFRAVYELKKQQVDQLHVRAGVTGMLQQLGNNVSASGATAPPLEPGQNVPAGAILAKIAQQDKLKAQIKVTETEAKDVSIGQRASIDTRNGIIPGHVSRIDPGAVNGTVLVDVTLEGLLPGGARPDLSVDGTIDIERLSDVLYVERPAGAQPNATSSLFRLDPDGKTATRIPVKLGRASVTAVEVLTGLRPSDTIILSDMTAQDGRDRIRLQ